MDIDFEIVQEEKLQVLIHEVRTCTHLSSLTAFDRPASTSVNAALRTLYHKLHKMVKTLPLGDILVPTPGFGAMGMSFGLGSNLSLEEAEPVLLKAIELGCTFWDTAVS